MMAILRAATRHKNLSRSLLRREKSFIQPTSFGSYSNSSNAAFSNHFAGSLIGEHDEDSDGDKLDKHADLSAQSDAYILLNRLDLGLQTGMITSVLMLENVKLLLQAGVTVPISFLFDSVELLAKRKEPHLIEMLLRHVLDHSQGLGGAYGRSLPGTNSKRENSSYEFDKLAGFGIKKTLAYSAVDALQLWTNLTAAGYKASRADLTEMLVEINKSTHLPDIEFPLKVIALMKQNAWNNSAKSYEATLAVYHSYLLRKNHNSLPALITVCNFFERTYKEYDTRISDSRRSMNILNDTLEGEESEGWGSTQRVQEIDALRASFWTAAYERSSTLRYVKGSEGRQSGEDVYKICKRRALEQHDPAFHATLKGKNENSGERFRTLANLFKETQKVYSSMHAGCQSSSSDSSPSVKIAFPLARVTELKAHKEKKRAASNNLDSVNFSHIIVEERPKKAHKKMAGFKTIGRSERVPKYVSEYDLRSEAVRLREDEGIGEEEEGEGEEAEEEAAKEEEEAKVREAVWKERVQEAQQLEKDVEDEDLFNNNNIAARTGNSRVVLQGADLFGSVRLKTHDFFFSNSSAHDTTDRKAENIMRIAMKRLVCHLAASSYEASNREELFMQLTRFMKQSAAESTYSREENKEFASYVLQEILMASRFTKPLRPAFLFRLRSDKGLSEAPEFILHYIPALSVEDATLTPAEYEQRQIAREEEGFTTGELDNFNRFCNVKRLHMHINKVNDLAGELEAWAQEMDVPLGTAFVAAHIKSFARPYYSEVNVKANMERPLSDFDWRIAMEAAEEVLATQPDDVINTPEVTHSLVSILCDHDNASKGTMDRAYRLCTQLKERTGSHPSPKTYALVVRCANAHLGNVDLPFFLKPIEEYAGIRYEGRGAIRNRSKQEVAPLNDARLISEILNAHSRLNNGYESLFLFQNLKAIGEPIKLTHIARTVESMSYTNSKLLDQRPILTFMTVKNANTEPLINFVLQEVQRAGLAIDHQVLLLCLKIHRKKILACRRHDIIDTMKDHRIAQVGADPNATESEATQKYDTITLATEDMVAFAKDFIDLESTHPADQIKKQWVLHHFLATYLSVQYVKQAHELLDDITTVYGCEPSHRYYDPFTNYFAVRGRIDRFNDIIQRMINKGVKPSQRIAEQTLTCYIIAAHKGQCDLSEISDKVQEMYNAYRIRPSATGMIRLIDYLLFVGDAQEARRAALLIVQIFTERERETETLWPSMYTPEIFTDGTTSDKLFRQLFPTKGMVYVNGFCRGKRGQLLHTALSQRFEKAGFLL